MTNPDPTPLLAQLLGPATDYLLERGDPRAAILQVLVEPIDPRRDPYRTVSLFCAAHGRGEMFFSRYDDRSLIQARGRGPSLASEYERIETIDLWRRRDSDRKRREEAGRLQALRLALNSGLIPPTPRGWNPDA